jgi:DNA-3-methyladenine glycosylase
MKQKKSGRQDQKALALWAADCAEHVLPYFEKERPKDDRPRKAIEAGRAWARGAMTVGEARKAALAAHAAARCVNQAAARVAARSAGHAAATAHVTEHAPIAADYAAKAAEAAGVRPRILDRAFYDRDSRKVAKDLLGKIFVYGGCSGRIVETEAYVSENDPGAKGGRLFTNPPKTLLGPPGHAFVYFTYGNHWMFNFVTEREGIAGAVLVRAVEPVGGIDLMKRRRGTKDIKNLTNGPGKFTQAFGINKSNNGQDVTRGPMRVLDNDGRLRIVTTTRIGLSCGQDLPYRYYIKDNCFVSKK